MSNPITTDRRLSYIRDQSCLTRPEEQRRFAELMPFGLNAQEARNLRDALEFLFILMTFHDELIEHNVPTHADETVH